jgi:hypothetical protein
MADPAHERERANALPSLVQGFWEEIMGLARVLGIEEPPSPQPLRGANIGCATEEGPRGRAAPRADIPPPGAGAEESVADARQAEFDPDLYATVYERLLRHRRVERLDVTSVLPVQGSVYDALDAVTDLMPTPAEVAGVMAEVERRPIAEVEREVADWYRL